MNLPEDVWAEHDAERHGAHLIGLLSGRHDDQEAAEVLEQILIGSRQLVNQRLETPRALLRVLTKLYNKDPDWL